MPSANTSRPGGRILVDALRVHGVDRLFCVPGESYLDVLDALYDDYGDTPKYRLVATLGNEYLHRMFPRMDYIRTARVVGAPPSPTPRP